MTRMPRLWNHPTLRGTRSGSAPAGCGSIAHRMGVSALVVLALITARPARAQSATVFHVDRQNPNATTAGPGTLLQPYSTIQSALNAHQEPGRTFIVHAGTYRERVVVPASGSPDAPIVIRAEGEVTLDGTDDLGETWWWTNVGGDVWLAPAVTWSPMQVFADGFRLTASTVSTPVEVVPGAFQWFAGVGLAVNVGGGNPGHHGLAVGHRSHGFLVQGRSSVFIDGFHVVRSEAKGVEMLGCTHVVVRNCTVTQSASGGVAAENCTDLQVQGNTVSDNNHHGIEFRSNVSNSRIEGNESFANVHVGQAWATGIYLANSPHNIIENNRLHHNQDSGCEIQSGSSDNLVRQNMAWANGDHGFAMLYATGTLLLNDVAWGNNTEGFSVEGSSTNTRIFNSISLNRALAAQTYCLFVDPTSTTGFDADFNVYWNTAGLPPIRYGGATFPNVVAFQTATGLGPHSYGADPRFVDATDGDFHLKSDSPAIDAATSAVSGWNESDAEGRMRTDAPGTPNTGDGLIGFADRGALEYQDAVLAVGDTPGGLGVTLAPAYPNPSRRDVTFALTLAAAAQVRLAVFDVMGREVWSEDGLRPAGHSETRWRLTDHSGARVSDGLYLARVERGGEQATVRFTVVR
jgi:parallel beta-helix repeat protein